MKDLNTIRPKILADIFKNEDINTIALMFYFMKPESIADVLILLEEDKRYKVCISMAKIQNPNEDIVLDIRKTIEEKLDNFDSYSSFNNDGSYIIARALNFTGTQTDDILGSIESIDTNIASNIKKNMFLFEDVLSLSISNITNLCEEICLDDLVWSLVNTDEKTLDKFMKAISSRGKEKFELKYNTLDKNNIIKIKKARDNIVDTALHLIEFGCIDLNYRDYNTPRKTNNFL